MVFCRAINDELNFVWDPAFGTHHPIMMRHKGWQQSEWTFHCMGGFLYL